MGKVTKFDDVNVIARRWEDLQWRQAVYPGSGDVSIADIEKCCCCIYRHIVWVLRLPGNTYQLRWRDPRSEWGSDFDFADLDELDLRCWLIDRYPGGNDGS